MIACLVHFEAEGLHGSHLADLCSGAATLLGRLQQHGVQAGLLLQCAAVGDAGLSLAALQAAADGSGSPLLMTQPGQLAVALRLALDQLAPTPPAEVAFISLSGSPAAASQAAELGCGTCEHLPSRGASPAQLQAWVMQAVARRAREARQAAGLQPPLVVGYVMKESRQLALAQQGMLPLLPAAEAGAAAGSTAAAESAAGKAAAQAGKPAAESEQPLCFVPLDLHSSLAPQLAHCDIVLQKLTDYLEPTGGSGAVAHFTSEAQALLARLDQEQQAAQQAAVQQQLAAAAAGHPHPGHPQLHPAEFRAAQAVAKGRPPLPVDPAPAMRPIMDRAALIPLLEAAALAVRQLAIPARAPASVLVSSFDPGSTPRQLAAAGVSLPCIAKPQAACGVAEAHQMAFVLHGSGFAGLEVPLPAVVQEYVDHGGRVWKVYVAGDQVFWAERKSTPDLRSLAEQLAADPEADVPDSISFDSLKSLPTTLPWLRKQQAQPQAAGGSADGGLPPVPGQVASLMQRPTFEAVAAALRKRLGLTLFGFDLVFDSIAGELVIIDVNYFPSFKGVPEAPAALRAALRQRYAAALATQQQP
ncbi:inositol 4-trisphosphate 5 6-kinase family [Chlorella sorokiniana]|uniref:inositol-1,3,4-trisphosphate 5/6-kinase n=1 Tax=Chlorella sorokiniana TaxID=3076 RepID=A0A2P6TL32_CHLSO|nr:inositol 4-trisphosphate 5 6-kinase family [Chlorella sorokiniana]|eukprot:PRW44989.1 inositol 4-trisphosphate 5 6-kinase family [Chlorella sorokiniana]